MTFNECQSTKNYILNNIYILICFFKYTRKNLKPKGNDYTFIKILFEYVSRFFLWTNLVLNVIYKLGIYLLIAIK